MQIVSIKILFVYLIHLIILNKMKREIKFRCWHKKKSKWLFGYEYKNLGGFSLFGEVVLMGELSQVTLDELNDIEIMQYTGLNDKNGMEIYENDILEMHQTINGQSKFVIINCIGEYDVRYLYNFERKYEYDIKDLLSIEEMEIIGNIYENPELAK